VEEGILYIELAYGPILGHNNAKDGADHGRLDNRAEGLVVVNAGLLGEAADDPACLVSGEGAV
jgi:hypothetical protein